MYSSVRTTIAIVLLLLDMVITSDAQVPSPAPYVFLTGPGCIALYKAYNSWLTQYGYSTPSGDSFFVTFATEPDSFLISFYQTNGSNSSLQQTYTEELTDFVDPSWPVITNTASIYAVPKATVTISGIFVRSVVAAYETQLAKLRGAARDSGFAFLTSPYALASFARDSTSGIRVRFSQFYMQRGPTIMIECYKEQLYDVSPMYVVKQTPCWR